VLPPTLPALPPTRGAKADVKSTVAARASAGRQIGDRFLSRSTGASGAPDAAHRADGWNAWLTFAISPAAAAPTAPTKPLMTK
jgi:hypothetical protein